VAGAAMVVVCFLVLVHCGNLLRFFGRATRKATKAQLQLG